MSQANQITFSYKELAEILVKNQEIHEGLWGIYIRFGIGAGNLGQSPTSQDVLPTAIVPVLEIGIQKFAEESNLTIDAGIVNPIIKNK